MRKRMYLICGIVMCVLLVGGGIHWRAEKKIRFVKQLGSGYNLGNSLDSTGLQEYKPDASALEYEVFWGNPEITSAQFAAIREAGFASVRIPVTWEEHMDENGVVSEEWMERVVEVVDMALAEGLYVIIDTHHEEWMNLKPECEKAIADKFYGLWTQIAERFVNYDERLLFEGMNEPRLRDSEYEWSAGTPEMQAMVNRLNQVFVEAVRNTGGNNQERYLLVCAYATNTEHEALANLIVPEGNVIVAVHMYLPYSFCQDDDGTVEWMDYETADTKAIEAVFADLEQLFLAKNIPVIITEFGCKDKGNNEERREWISFYRNFAGEDDIPYFWWDNGSSYQILNREDGTWVYPDIVEALIR